MQGTAVEKPLSNIQWWLVLAYVQAIIRPRIPLIRISNNPDWLGPSGKSVDNSTQLTCFEITSYRIKYSTVFWLLGLQIRRGRKFQTQIHNVNSNSRNANYPM